jgi:hypothetical protein
MLPLENAINMGLLCENLWTIFCKQFPARDILTRKGRTTMLTIEKKAELALMAEQGQAVQAIEMCIAACEDYLVAKLLKQGGFGTMQLNEIGQSPKIKFVRPEEAKTVERAIIAGREVHAAQLNSAKPGSVLRLPSAHQEVSTGIRDRIAHLPRPLLDALRKKLTAKEAA